jgi:hypothetical protein
MVSPTRGDRPHMNGLFFASTPRMHMVWDVLDAAKANGDEIVIAGCRRLIIADRLGWKKHAERSDIELVIAFAD